MIYESVRTDTQLNKSYEILIRLQLGSVFGLRCQPLLLFILIKAQQDK
jgi:hypothetical protein